MPIRALNSIVRVFNLIQLKTLTITQNQHKNPNVREIVEVKYSEFVLTCGGAAAILKAVLSAAAMLSPGA